MTHRHNIPHFGFLLALGAASLSMPGCSRESPKPRVRSLPVQVRAARIVDGYERVREFSGRVVARREATLGFEVGGRLVEVSGDDGDRLRRGSVVARLDDTSIQARLAVARADVAVATATLAELDEGPRRERIDASRARLAELEAQLALARVREKRSAALERERVSSTAELDERRFAREALEGGVEASRRALEELVNGTRKTSVAAAKARLASARGRVAELEAERAKHEIRAPWDLIVRRRSADEGQILAAGSAVLDALEDAPLEARVGVPRALAGSESLRVGARIPCVVRGRELEARVRQLVPSVRARARTRSVVLDFVREDDRQATGEGLLVSGDVVRARLRDFVAERGAWLPVDSLTRSRKGLWACFAVQEDASGVLRVSRREVEVMHTDGRRCFVRGTLRDGDRIVASGTARLATRQRVRIVGATSGDEER